MTTSLITLPQSLSSVFLLEKIAIRRRPLHQHISGRFPRFLAPQVTSFSPTTWRRVRKGRPGSDRTTEEELTILIGLLQWCNSWGRPTQTGKATREPLKIAYFSIQERSVCCIVLRFCHWLRQRGMITIRARGHHVIATCTGSGNHLIWYRLQAFYIPRSREFVYQINMAVARDILQTPS